MAALASRGRNRRSDGQRLGAGELPTDGASRPCGDPGPADWASVPGGRCTVRILALAVRAGASLALMFEAVRHHRAGGSASR